MRTDYGKNYIRNQFQEWVKRRDIVHEARTAYLPEFNRAIEVLNRTLPDMSRTVMLGKETQRKDL